MRITRMGRVRVRRRYLIFHRLLEEDDDEADFEKNDDVDDDDDDDDDEEVVEDMGHSGHDVGAERQLTSSPSAERKMGEGTRIKTFSSGCSATIKGGDESLRDVGASAVAIVSEFCIKCTLAAGRHFSNSTFHICRDIVLTIA